MKHHLKDSIHDVSEHVKDMILGKQEMDARHGAWGILRNHTRTVNNLDIYDDMIDLLLIIQEHLNGNTSQLREHHQ